MPNDSFWQQGLTGPQCIVRHYADQAAKEATDKFQVFGFEGPVTSAIVIKKMRQEGYVPANIEDSREFAVEFGYSMPVGMSIIALAENTPDGEEEFDIGVLERREEDIRLYSCSPKKDFPPGSNFLGILQLVAGQESGALSLGSPKAIETFGASLN